VNRLRVERQKYLVPFLAVERYYVFHFTECQEYSRGARSPYATDNRNPFSRGHSPPSHVNVTNTWSYSFNPPYDTHIVSRDLMCKLQERILQVMYTKKSLMNYSSFRYPYEIMR